MIGKKDNSLSVVTREFQFKDTKEFCRIQFYLLEVLLGILITPKGRSHAQEYMANTTRVQLVFFKHLSHIFLFGHFLCLVGLLLVYSMVSDFVTL